MRLIKMLGLVTVVAVAAMAFIGASSAMAMNTALCSSNEGGALACSAGKQVTGLHTVASDLVFLTNVGNVLCKESLMELNVLGLGAPQVTHLTKLTWTGCSAGGTACTITTVASAYS